MDHNNLPDISLFHDRIDVQIRFNDVDVLGHVNNTVYFAFYDTGKAHYFNSVGGKPVDWKHVDKVIANVNCSFMAPIFYGEEIEVLTTCHSISTKSIRLLQVIREKNTGCLKSACETVMVCFDPASGLTVPVPDDWKESAARFENRSLTNKPL